MSTLLSSTNSLGIRRGSGAMEADDLGAVGDLGFLGLMILVGQGFHKLQDFLDMPRHFDTSPFAPEYPFGVDHECAPIDATDLLAVHVFHLHHPEQVANRLVRVAQQFERKIHFCLEFLMRLDVVTRNTHYVAIGIGKFGVSIPEFLAFGGASRRIILWIEIDDQVLFTGYG